jgi:hypothetical protein
VDSVTAFALALLLILTAASCAAVGVLAAVVYAIRHHVHVAKLLDVAGITKRLKKPMEKIKLILFHVKIKGDQVKKPVKSAFPFLRFI